MKKITLVYIMLLLPLLSFSQMKVSYYLNKNIDFVLDSDFGRKFLGNIVTKYIKTDSTNHFYNKTGILPFYRYVESDFFDKKFLESKMFVIDKNKSSFECTIEPENHKNGIDYEFNLDFCRGCSMTIESSVLKGNIPNKYFGFSKYHFKNFCLSSSTDNRKSREHIKKEYYSKVTVSQQGSMNIFDEDNDEGTKEFVFYNTLNIDYINKKNNINFLVKIYEKIWNHTSGQRYNKKDLAYLNRYMDVLMRKVEITGNKEEAVKYLVENQLNYNEIEPEKYIDQDFQKNIK